MSDCAEFVPLLEARLTESLGVDAARLEQHAATCAACRAEMASQDEVLSLARLPEASAEDLRALEGLSLLTWRALERRRVRRFTLWGGLGLALAAALAFVVAAPQRAAAPVARPSELVRAPPMPATSGGEAAVVEAVEDGADDTLDLEDFAALDVMPGTSPTTLAGGDDDDDETLFQGEEL